VQTGLAAGSYTFTVKDANNCTITVPVTITQPTAITASASAGTIACNGGTTTLTATAGGGTSPYTYSLDGTTFQAGNTFHCKCRNYTVTIKDANGCTATATAVTITQPTAITATTAITNVLCNGASTGSVIITPSGGTGPYSITPAQTGLAAGSYTFTVKDANNCTITVPVTITQPTAITASASAGTIACNGGTTTLTATAGGGISPYTYSLNGTTFQAGNTFTVSAGTYTVTIKDANGCTAGATAVTVTQPAPITATTAVTNVLCNGASTGSVIITPSGGTGPYTITPAQTALAAGSYTFTVKDANNCTITFL
jgi:hypothetical protein